LQTGQIFLGSLISSSIIVSLLERHTTASQQVYDKHYYCDDQHKMNQISSNSSDETEQPEYENDHKNCPKHNFPLYETKTRNPGQADCRPVNVQFILSTMPAQLNPSGLMNVHRSD